MELALRAPCRLSPVWGSHLTGVGVGTGSWIQVLDTERGTRARSSKPGDALLQQGALESRPGDPSYLGGLAASKWRGPVQTSLAACAVLGAGSIADGTLCSLAGCKDQHT